jgi:DedD protein
MAWPSLFRRKAPAEPLPHPAARQAARRRAGATAGDVAGPDVEQARTRARRRLIGATVLLGVGIIAFPLLFETEPRPIPVDLPIEIPRPDAVPPLALPSASSAASPGRSSGTVVEPADAAAAQAPAPQARPAPAGTAPARAAEPAVAQVAAPKEAPGEAPKEAAKEAVKETPAAPTADGERARALLEGRPVTVVRSVPDPAPAAAAATTRFVVQVGAYADDGAVRAVRARVERLGLRTYTQVAKGDAGDRTRVRIGPFDDRAKADDVAARLKQAGLPAAVLRL